MTKNNPLFTDSTVLQGDPIGTQIELNRVCLLEGESLYLVLMKSDGQEAYLPMEQVGDTSFEVFVRLVHQRQARFYFGIEKSGELLMKSEVYERVARHALLEDWEPVEMYYPEGRARKNEVHVLEVSEDLEPAQPVECSDESPLEATENDLEGVGKTTSILKPDQVSDITGLMEKWGFV